MTLTISKGLPSSLETSYSFLREVAATSGVPRNTTLFFSTPSEAMENSRQMAVLDDRSKSTRLDMVAGRRIDRKWNE